MTVVNRYGYVIAAAGAVVLLASAVPSDLRLWAVVVGSFAAILLQRALRVGAPTARSEPELDGIRARGRPTIVDLYSNT